MKETNLGEKLPRDLQCSSHSTISFGICYVPCCDCPLVPECQMLEDTLEAVDCIIYEICKDS